MISRDLRTSAQASSAMTTSASCRATASSSSNETGPIPTVTLRSSIDQLDRSVIQQRAAGRQCSSGGALSLSEDRRSLALPSSTLISMRRSKLVRRASAQVDHPSAGHLIEPVNYQGPTAVAQQLVVDRETLQRADCAHE